VLNGLIGYSLGFRKAPSSKIWIPTSGTFYKLSIEARNELTKCKHGCINEKENELHKQSFLFLLAHCTTALPHTQLFSSIVFNASQDLISMTLTIKGHILNAAATQYRLIYLRYIQANDWEDRMWFCGRELYQTVKIRTIEDSLTHCQRTKKVA